MIEYIIGDIFTSPAQVIVNTVNTVGVMGKGIALEYKKRYPRMFELYKTACEKKRLQIGKLMLVNEQDHLILLFPTKESWRLPSKIEYIEKGLKTFVDKYTQNNITSIAFPKLGCGNGELSWDIVKPLMEKYLKDLPIDVYIYLGNDENTEPEHKHTKEMQEWLRANAKNMSFNGLVEDIKQTTYMLPYEMYIDQQRYEVTFKEELKIKGDSCEISISEEELYTYWDEIRNSLVIIVDKEKKKYFLTCELLASLNYLVKIKKLNKVSGEMQEGYQLNEGLGRVHAYSGA
ncbi:MAG: macro domain-containing protein [Muribaculaceae bacterium]|nr:macro domain-containing protein [Muribaculaceae bacterium]